MDKLFKVLVVEDEAITSMDIKARLKQLGFDVPAIASSGEEAIMLAEKLMPDLILMDIILKGEMDGTVAANVITHRFNIPIVFITAFNDKNTFTRAKEANPYGYLVKPFETKDLSNAVDLALFKHASAIKIINAEKRYHAIMDYAYSAIIVYNDDGVIQENNKAAAVLFQQSESSLIGKNIKDFLESNDIANFEQEVKRLLKINNATINVKQILRPDGTKRDVEILATAINIGNDKILYSIINDITDKNILISQNLLNGKLVAIGTLSASIMHEINNPLACIFLNLEMSGNVIAKAIAKESNDDMLELNQMISQSMEGAKRIKSIVSDLKEFGRKDEDKMIYKNINDIIESATNIVLPHFKHIAVLKKDLTNDIPQLWLNHLRIEQVLVNILINASQSFVDKHDYDHNIVSVTSKLENNMVCITISDTGKGMSPDTLSNIFEPFFTTKSIGVGTGLGLSISKDIVESHGGRIAVESKVGVGTTFSIYLPIQSTV